MVAVAAATRDPVGRGALVSVRAPRKGAPAEPVVLEPMERRERLVRKA